MDSFGICLTNPAFFSVGEKRRFSAARVMIVALLNRKCDVGKTTVDPGPVGVWVRQRSRFIVIDADRQGRKGKSWLDWSKERANEGATGPFGVIALVPDAPQIARRVNPAFVEEPWRLETLIRWAPVAADIVVKPVQLWPSDEGTPGDTGKLQKEALDFGNELQASFALTCRAIAALIARDGAAPLAEGEPPPRSRAYWRVAFTDAARSGSIISDADEDSHSAQADHRTCRRSRDHPKNGGSRSESRICRKRGRLRA